MRIESLSIKSATTAIFMMIAVVAIILSLLAGSYFRRSALDAQMSSLSRVLEVATQEMLKEARLHSFDIGMKLAHSSKLITAFNEARQRGEDSALAALLDDPFITGFVGFSRIDLVKLRVYDASLDFVSQSNAGMKGLSEKMPGAFLEWIINRDREDRLKAVDGVWLSENGPLFSSIVPLGGLRAVGYLEVVIDPVFNLPEIARITGTSVSIYNMSGELINAVNQGTAVEYLPVEYEMHTIDGLPAFRIVGMEDVETLNAEMVRTQTVTITGFLVLALGTLVLAIWLFNRFMLKPVSSMVKNMRMMADGNLDMSVDSRGLMEYHVLANTFNSMADQVRMRTNDLERLLDLDDSAIICFDNDREMVFFNQAAATLFGYGKEDISEQNMFELFEDDIPRLVAEGKGNGGKVHTLLGCKHKDGQTFKCDAVINAVDVMGQGGYAVALNNVIGDDHVLSEQSEQRLVAVEQSLSSLLEFARNNPSLVPGKLGDAAASSAGSHGVDKAVVRDHAVGVMNLALACWEHELGKSKLELAEESGIWPVYIDKSTPTTRTLDKYLNLATCPKNPRSQRVVDTAEFVIRRVANPESPACTKLQAALDNFRILLSGVQPGN